MSINKAEKVIRALTVMEFGAFLRLSKDQLLEIQQVLVPARGGFERKLHEHIGLVIEVVEKYAGRDVYEDWLNAVDDDDQEGWRDMQYLEMSHDILLGRSQTYREYDFI